MLTGVLVGCAAGGSEASAGSGSSDRGAGGSNYSYGSGGAGGYGNVPGAALNLDAAATKSDAPPLPPEKEQKVDFLAPRAGARYVYVANPTRNTVSVIDSDTLAVRELAPGDSPTYVATVPGQDVALVVNAGSHTLRILRGTSMNERPIPIIAKANAISISPDGMHAVIWFDASLVDASTTSSNASTTGSTQEVSLVKLALATDNVFSMSVGYNPSAVVFSNDNAAAFVVTDDGISELRFASITAPAIAPFTRFNGSGTSAAPMDAGGPEEVSPAPAPAPAPAPDAGSNPTGDDLTIDGGAPSIDGGVSDDDGGDTTDLPPPDTGDAGPDLGSPDLSLDLPPVKLSNSSAKPVDVSVTSDGSYAIARREGTAELLLVDLRTHVLKSITLSSTITDLDLLPSGTDAFAVLREESKLVRIEVPGGFFDPARRHELPAFAVGTIGSVTLSPQGRYALLYTTAISSLKLVVLDLNGNTADALEVDVKKPIRAVAIAPDEKTALVLHTAPIASGAGGATSPEEKSHGYTLVHLEDGYRKTYLTAAEPFPFAITPNSTHAFVLLRNDQAGVRIAERVSLTSFIADDFQLGSPPSSIAALSEATHKVFVGQVHAEGRISFIDWITGSVESVTGFALNGRIQQ